LNYLLDSPWHPLLLRETAVYNGDRFVQVRLSAIFRGGILELGFRLRASKIILDKTFWGCRMALDKRLDRRAGARLRGGILCILATSATMLAIPAWTGVACAAEPAKYGNALDWVPADAAHFATHLRLKEQLDIVLASKAWAKLKEQPWAQQFSQQIELVMAFQPNIQQGLQQPENQQLIAMLGDLASHEITYYIDQHTVDMFTLTMESVNRASTSISTTAGQADRPDPSIAMQRGMLKFWDENRDKIETPTIVMAFKHTDADRVKAQLARLEKLAEGALENVPEMKGRFKREKVGNGELLTLTFDGQMIPWDQVPLDKLEKQPHEFEKLVEKIKKLQLVISIGLHDDYLLISITPSTDKLAALGQGPRLAERPEFAKLTPFAEKRVVGVSFTTKEASAAMVNYQFVNFHNSMQNLIGMASLPTEQKAKLVKDVDDFFKDIMSLMPVPGDKLSVSTLTERGYDCYSYDWSKNPIYDGSKPLALLDHLGGSPLVAVCARAARRSGEQYPMLVKWLEAAHSDFEQMAVPHMSPEDQKQYQQWMEFAKPLLARLDTATKTMLIPAMAEGESAVVLDAKITSGRWFKKMPATEVPLPMIEPAVVMSVTDADLLKKGIKEYQAVLEELLGKIAKEDPNALPPGFRLPEPQRRESKAGTVYAFHFPKAWEVDAQLAPAIGLSPHVAVLAIAPKHASELLALTPLDTEGPLADTKRPLAAAVLVDWAGIVEAATPWIEHAVTLTYSDAGRPGRGPDDLKSTLKQIRSGLEILKCLRTVSSATYAEEQTMVTHTEVHIRDLP
jgi:hypothetical protein